MADTKLSALTEDTSPTTDDLVYTVNDPGGTPVSKKVTLANIAVLIWNYLTSLTAKTTLADADQLALADSAASNASKKITWQNVMAQAAAYTQTLTNKTLTAPTIADFTNAAHDHGDADDGGAVVSASTTVSGVVEIAINTEVNTGTDAARAISPDAFAGSNFGIRYVACHLNGTTALTTAEKVYFRIPAAYTGMNLVSVTGSVGTGAAGSSSSGTPTFTVRNVTDNQQMLSTSLTIDASEYTSATAATAAVINATYDDVVTDDLIEVAVTTSGTGVTYAVVTLGFQLP